MSGGGPGWRRPPWSEFRAALDRAGFRPSRRLGQNLLVDENMVRAIARDAGVGEGDFVLEVGPGCGFLSAHLLERGVELLAVEIDARLLEVARELLAPFPGVTLLEGDVLEAKGRLEPRVAGRLPAEGPWFLVSNLPYSVGSPVLVLCARTPNPPTSMTVLIQRELAERVAANPGTAAWGALSARLQIAYSVGILRTVPAHLFWPRPRVESAVLRLDLRPERPPAPDLDHFDALVGGLFQRRRQALGRVLAARLGGREAALELLGAQGLEPSIRAETLGPEVLLALSRDPLWRSRPAGEGP